LPTPIASVVNIKMLLLLLLLQLYVGIAINAQTQQQTDTARTVVVAQNIFDLPHSLAFAQYLLDSQQFEAAIAEYERAVFMQPTNDSIFLQLLKAYELGQQYQQGITRCQNKYPNARAMPPEIAAQYGKLLLRLPNFANLDTLLNKPTRLLPLDEFYLQGGSLLLQQKWQEAEQYAASALVAAQPVHPLANQYHTFALKGQSLRYKSPALAVGMSAVVPGLGKVYTGNWQDGLIAFIIVGSNAWQAYNGFSKKGVKSVNGWIFGSLATGFYFGNLFGSHKAAKTRNHKTKHALMRQIENTCFGFDGYMP
jgi:tetratricopeptide (TPR) repeat protein